MKRISIEKTKKRNVDYYILLFFTIACIGWMWEVLLYLLTQRELINRGVYFGPYLPIYGFGGVFLCCLLYRCRRRHLLCFTISALLCTALEYAGSLMLEFFWGQRWWDYSDMTFHLQGRVCLLGALGFGFGGIFLVCLYQPLFDKCYRRCPPRLRMGVAIMLVLLFIVDAAYCALMPHTGPGITQ